MAGLHSTTSALFDSEAHPRCQIHDAMEVIPLDATISSFLNVDYGIADVLPWEADYSGQLDQFSE
jgi:hypothetical protein